MSGLIRQRIGQEKRRLLLALSKFHEFVLPDSLNSETDDSLLDVHHDLLDLHRSIIKPYSTLSRLATEWTTIINSSADESEVFRIYIQQYGDFRINLSDAAADLVKLDGYSATVHEELHRRNVPPEFYDNESEDSGSNKGEEFVRNVKVSDIPLSTSKAADVLQTKLPYNVDLPAPTSKGPQRQHPPLPLHLQEMQANPMNHARSAATTMNTVPNTVIGLTPQTNSPYISTHPTLPMPPIQQPMMSNGYSMPIPQPSLQQIGHMGSYWPTTPILQPPSNLNNFVDSSMLQRIDLPEFSGDILRFPEFWARFNTLVHSKQTLDNATKFSLLKSCLRGNALATIDGIPVIAEYYDFAVINLRDTFDDKTTTLHILYSRLASLPSCDKGGDQLHALYLEMNKLVRQYISLKPTGDTEFGLGAILLNKLPKSIKSKIYDETHNSRCLTPTELLTILSGIVHKQFVLHERDCYTEQRTDTVFHVHQRKNGPDNRHKSGARSMETHNGNQHRNGNGNGTRHCNGSDNGNGNGTRNGNGSNPGYPLVNNQVNRGETREYRDRQKKCQLCPEEIGHIHIHCPKEYNQRIRSALHLRLCFVCLKKGHHSNDCSEPKCYKCQQNHHTCLHPPANLPSNSAPAVPRPNGTAQQNRNSGFTGNQNRFNNSGAAAQQRHQRPSHQTHYVQIESQSEEAGEEDFADNVFVINEDSVAEATSELQVLPFQKKECVLMCSDATVFNPSNPSLRKKVLVFFDCGASDSYISEELAEDLQMDSSMKEPILLNTFAQKQATTVQTSRHVLGLSLLDNETVHMAVKSLPKLTNELNCITVNKNFNMKELTAIATTRRTPSLLIGVDYFWKIILGSQFYAKQLANGCTLLNSKIGPILAGTHYQPPQDTVYTVTTDNDTYSKSSLDHIVEKFFLTESLGFLNWTTTDEDSECLEHFRNNIRFDELEKRYYVRWPFRLPKEQLGHHYNLCFSRLQSIWKHLSTSSEWLEKYNDILVDQLSKEIIEEIPFDKTQLRGKSFLPHHPVVTETKKHTKVRMVFAGNAKGKGPTDLSLNECLFTGPTLLPNLLGLLLRIRKAPILLSSDIEKAFLMIGLEEEDRNYCCFLWLRDPTKPPSDGNLRMFRFRRVPFGIVTSPFLLSASIHYHLMHSVQPVARKMLANLYVDNSFLEAQSVQEAKEMYTQSKELFSAAKMNIREWISSSAEVNEFLQKEENTTIDETTSILGLIWNPQTDQMAVKVPQFPNLDVWTKRQVMRCVASVFDPYGILTPATLVLKIFLQQLWKTDLKWDTPLNRELQKTWIESYQTWNSKTN